MVELADHMREADVQEVRASGGYQQPIDAVFLSVEISAQARTAFIDDRVAAICGVVLVRDGSLIERYFNRRCSYPGVAWALTSQVVDLHPLLFAAASRRLLEEADWLAPYDLVCNFVSAENTPSLRWLRWLGFEVLEPIPFGPRDLPFHPVVKERTDV
ncbi:MAG: hypothetical protein P1V51_22385 [Deltaproteobacteria bacterium]|nr:hypothetical protein [Deltaproteobacteria bacterium]